MYLKINNWHKYNKRKDIKNPFWFALSNRIFQDPDLIDFSHQELISWIYLLCLASQTRTDCVRVNFKHVQLCARVNKLVFLSAVQKLENLSMITRVVRDTNVPCTESDRYNTIQYNTNNNAHVEHVHEHVNLDFEHVYENYPRKLGKKRGLERLKKKIKTAEQFENLLKAVDNYAAHCKTLDPQYIKHFSTFVNEWEDWVEFKPESKIRPIWS